MTKAQLKLKLRAIGHKHTDAAVAELFGVSPQAVNQWPSRRPIPELRLLQLKVYHPELKLDNAAS